MHVFVKEISGLLYVSILYYDIIALIGLEPPHTHNQTQTKHQNKIRWSKEEQYAG
jgi:hypothetical protein